MGVGGRGAAAAGRDVVDDSGDSSLLTGVGGAAGVWGCKTGGGCVTSALHMHCQQESDSRETITAVVTICADGSSIPPLVIFKGKAFSVKWGDNNPLKAS